MKATFLDGTPEEIAAFIKASGMALATTTASAEEAAPPATASDVSDFVERRVRGNKEKQHVVQSLLDAIGDDLLRVRVGVKENGSEADYVTGRLTTVDEDRVGNVIYCRPSSATVWLRLPVEAIADCAYAQRVDSKKSDAEFAKVKHQVILKLANDDAVAEAIELTKLAVTMAMNNEW